MASLNLTWSEPNKCYVKSLGYWHNLKGDRVPRYFRFTHPQGPEGEHQAQQELIPLIAQWMTIKAEAKKLGNKYPVWHRPKLVATKLLDTKKGLGSEREELALETMRQAKAAKAIEANEAANPDKPLHDVTIEQAVKAYRKHCEGTAMGSETVRDHMDWLKLGLSPVDQKGPMIQFTDLESVIQYHLNRVKADEIKPRTALNYCYAVKYFAIWYGKKVRAYPIPDDLRAMFSKKRFKNNGTENAIFTIDGEERDFEIYSTADLKAVFDNLVNDRQRLYVLLGLNAAMLYVDIATLQKANCHMDDPKPFLFYKRKKESHHDPLIQKVWLWPETCRLLKQEINGGETITFALLRRKNGDKEEAMTKFGPELTWARLRSKLAKALPHRKSVRYMDLRKTGGSAIANHSSIDLAELHLGHKIQSMGKVYIKLAKDRLYDPLMKWRDELVKGKVFEGFQTADEKKWQPVAAEPAGEAKEKPVKKAKKKA